MKALELLACVLLLFGSVSCSRDPDVVKRKYVEHGNRYFEKGNYKQASLMYRNALRKDRKYSEAYYRLALTDLELGSPAAAYRNFRRAADTDPKNMDARAKAAEIALMAFLSSPKLASFGEDLKSLYQDILSKDPNSVAGLRLRAYHKLAVEKDVPGALEDLRRVNQLGPNDPKVVLPMADLLFSRGNAEESEQLLKSLIAKGGPGAARAYDVLYLQYMQKDRKQEAEAVLKQKVARYPKDLGARLQLAAHYHLTQRPAEVKAAIDGIVADPADFPNGRFAAARFYAGIRDLDTAMRHLQEGAKTSDPILHGSYQRAMAELMIAQNKPGDALRLLDQALEDNPKDEQAKAIRASVQIQGGDPKQVQAATSELEAALKVNPRNPVTRFNYARALIARRQYDQAILQLRESAKLQSNYIPPRIALAEIQMLQGEAGAALNTAREILTNIDPRYLPARLLEAGALAATGDRAQARQQLAAILKDNPNSVEAQIQIALLDLTEKRFKEAETAFARIHDANPGDIRALTGLVEVYAAQNQFDRGARLLEAELAKDPNRQQLRMAYANLCFRAGRLDQAAAEYKRLIQADPNRADTYIRLGEAYGRKGNAEDSIRAFQKARELRPNDPVAPLRLAMLYDGAGQRDSAKPLYELVLRLQPDNGIAMNNLAYLLADGSGDLDEALRLAQRAKQKYPDQADISDTLGWIYIKKNLSDNAIEIFKELVAKYPDRPMFRYHLGMALFQKGDKSQAKRELMNALERKPPKAEEPKIRELIAKIG